MRVSSSDPTVRVLAEPDPWKAGAPDHSDPEPSAFRQALSALSSEINQGEATLRVAIRSMSIGADLGPARIIALQASVYRYSEAIDLASRLVDRVTGGVKTVVQSSGQ